MKIKNEFRVTVHFFFIFTVNILDCSRIRSGAKQSIFVLCKKRSSRLTFKCYSSRTFGFDLLNHESHQSLAVWFVSRHINLLEY
jgi:hypothetical protein